MNKKQYNNVIDWTLKHEQAAKSEDSLETARAIFKNMGVALPNGSMQEVFETIKTNNYMGWKACTMEEAQQAADKGVAAIGISEDQIVVLAANDEDEPVAQTASVMTLSENNSAYAVSDLQYYTYSNSTTTEDSGVSQTVLFFEHSNLSVSVGWSGYNQLYGSTVSTIYWTSSDTSVASVNYYSGQITANNAGITTVTAHVSENSSLNVSFEIWVKGKTPVFLIHGRTSHAETTWGVTSSIAVGENDHFDSDITANTLNGKKYTIVGRQVITGFLSNIGGTEKPRYLGNALKDAGYQENVNLFAFNYPNQDAVVHSAKKFEAYINNLVSHVRSYGSNKMKACFYSSRADYDNNNYKINLVGHSMGGLVSRYYIENLGHDDHVDKLITICTPHWGSGYAELANTWGIAHVLCDHDLDKHSAMYGGGWTTNLVCNALLDLASCYNESYTLTDELQYSKNRQTKYYAIAGIDYDADLLDSNDYAFEMPTHFTTYQQIADYMTSKSVCKHDLFGGVISMPVKDHGDNMVGFMSQIGWTETNADSPAKRIAMEKIYVDVDTNGGNGGEAFIWEVALNGGQNILHNKINCRIPVCNKVIEYLGG